jgi:transposase-like protein
MRKHECPYCPSPELISDTRINVVRNGYFRRKSDHRKIRRYRCLRCLKYFSFATTHPCFGQNKRQLNDKIRKLFCSGVSQRRIAKLLNISRDTVATKLKFLGKQARINNLSHNFQCESSPTVQFDEMETFEHTKLKPLSIPLAVDKKTRRILGFKVAVMPAKGHLAKLSRKKYGKRPDERIGARLSLLEEIQPFVYPFAEVESDQHPFYPREVKLKFPLGRHSTHPGQRGSIFGQGELKKVRFDPLFSLNHTCAMLRANINRLFRKTWCTTKNRERLVDHISIYVEYHNKSLIA